MSARAHILARIQAARPGAAEPPPPTAVADAPAPSRADLADRFCRRAAQLGSDVARVAALADVPAAVARYLDAHTLGRAGACWPGLLDLPWAEAHIALEARGARGEDGIGATGAFAGIAETGTLMLLSGPDTPATVSLLPETHIAVVSADLVVATMEDAWARMRAQGRAMPRAVNFVSGPSRTADVEQTVTLGAHGPRRVLIVFAEG